MEMTAQLMPSFEGHPRSTSPSVLHLPSIKLHSLGVAGFLDLGFDDSFSEILPHIEDDLDSLTEVFDPVRDGPTDFLDDSMPCSSEDSGSSPELPPRALNFSDISSSPDTKDVLSRALEFSELTCLDANREQSSCEEPEPFTEDPPLMSNCCFTEKDITDTSPSICDHSAITTSVPDYQEELSTCRFSVSLSDLVNEPCPVSAAFQPIAAPPPEPSTAHPEVYPPHINTFLFQREQEIRRRLEILRLDYSQDVQELCQFYMYQSATIETERQQQTRPPCPPDHALTLHHHYDHQLHQMMDRVEQSICLLEDAQTSPPLPDPSMHLSHRPVRKQRASFPRKAIQIMEDWYQKNVDHPYPDTITVELIAIQGGISAEQVKKWFGNKRNRSNNTRTLTEIAKKKRQLAYNCFSELSL